MVILLQVVQMIEVCGYGKSKNLVDSQVQTHNRNALTMNQELKTSPRRWKRQAIIPLDVAISDISFAPVHHGLKLASVSPTGTMYVHEAPEPQDTSIWVMHEQIQILRTPPPREVEVSFVVEYCPSGWGGEQLAVGAMDTVRIYRRTESGKLRAVEELGGHKNLVRGIAWAPTMGRSYHLIATACKDGHVRIFKLTDAKTNTSPRSRKTTSLQGTGNAGRSSGGLGSLIEKATASAAIGGTRGPSGERGFAGADELLGPGLELKEGDEEDEDMDDGMNQYSVQLIADLEDHRREVWRVRWNSTGTILISAGDDGKIRLWKATLSGEFKCLSAISSKKAE